jgi:hypothetical protein
LFSFPGERDQYTGTPGEEDTGDFILSGEFFSNAAETILVGPAPNLITPYSVTVSNLPLATPEPATPGLLLLGLTLCGLATHKRTK